VPGRIALLPRNKVGYPVPWFVATIDGQPDFRVIRAGGIQAALRQNLCWVCGCSFLRQEDRAFTIGPMCAVNRVSAEPPSHRDCAVWSARNCPFLATPRMVRRDRHKPEGAVNPAGIMLTRNPGVALVWVTRYRSWGTRPDGNGGREATRTEVLASIDSGLPLLREMAEQDGRAAVAELEVMHGAALALVPAGAP